MPIGDLEDLDLNEIVSLVKGDIDESDLIKLVVEHLCKLGKPYSLANEIIGILLKLEIIIKMPKCIISKVHNGYDTAYNARFIAEYCYIINKDYKYILKSQ